ncbi:hypothetical protein DFQ26_006441 [Actinomortierella ambigua]|nr:hypothetical protein DFQ26_006441 [Actinomortierella ambigua]
MRSTKPVLSMSLSRHGLIDQQQPAPLQPQHGQRRWFSASGTPFSDKTVEQGASCSGLKPRPPLPPLGYILLPGLDYLTGLELQQHLVDRQLQLRKAFLDQQGTQSEQTQQQQQPNNDVLLLVEHTPVYTNGRRNRGNKAVSPEEVQRLQSLGADYVETLRGGEITYHGPGQLVAYPILDIKQADLSVRCYVSYLEKAIIATSASLGITAKTTEHTGVWVTDTKKLAAIGVHVQRYITSHGLALNCSTDLRFFNNIVACGLTGKQTTSITKEKQEQQENKAHVAAASSSPSLSTSSSSSSPPLWDVQAVLPYFVQGFAQVFQRDVVPLAQVNPALEQEIRAFRRKSTA